MALPDEEVFPVGDFLPKLSRGFLRSRLRAHLLDLKMDWHVPGELVSDVLTPLADECELLGLRLGTALAGRLELVQLASRLESCCARVASRLGVPARRLTPVPDGRLAPDAWEVQVYEEQVSRGQAEGAEPEQVMAAILLQLEHVLCSHAAPMLSLREVQELVGAVRHKHPLLVKEVLKGLSWNPLRQILTLLLHERVPIRGLPRILQAILDHLPLTKDPEMLVEFVRRALGRTIVAPLLGCGDTVHVVTLSPQVEKLLSSSVVRTEAGSFLVLDPAKGVQILWALKGALVSLSARDCPWALLTAPPVRKSMNRLTDLSFPSLTVLSWNEVPPRVKVESVEMVEITLSGLPTGRGYSRGSGAPPRLTPLSIRPV